MLTYLDSAHFAYLERAKPQEIDRFQSAWSDAGCTLAISLHHLQEMAQLADDASFHRRLKTLSLFEVVRGGQATSELSLRLEIQLRILKNLGYSPDVRTSALENLFPIHAQSDLLAAATAFRPIFQKMREPLTIAASAANLVKGREQPSYKRRIPLDDATRRSARALAAEAAAGLPLEVGSLLGEIFNKVEAELDESRSIRSALESLFRLGSTAELSKFPDSDLAILDGFFRKARNEATALVERHGLTFDPTQVANELDPYACQGFALTLAVRRARGHHLKPDTPSDDIDLSHLAFTPFVDLTFVDKRTYEFISQEARKDKLGVGTAAFHNIARVTDLRGLEESIRRRAALA